MKKHLKPIKLIEILAFLLLTTIYIRSFISTLKIYEVGATVPIGDLLVAKATTIIWVVESMVLYAMLRQSQEKQIQKMKWCLKVVKQSNKSAQDLLKSVIDFVDRTIAKHTKKRDKHGRFVKK